MPVKICRGPRDECLQALREDRFDLEQYPLLTYGDLDAFRVEGQEIRIFQGVNTVPHARFVVSRGDRGAEHAGMDLPGIVPFLGSTFQVSARKRVCDPHPLDVGLPLITADAGCLIRWMFARGGATHTGQVLWRRLTDDQLRGLPQDVKPDRRIDPEARTVASYQDIAGGVAAPEPVDFVRPRAGGLPHEPWLARSIDLAEGWRVVVPNTSISCRPVIIPPLLTIVGQNFNIVLCSSAEAAVAIGLVLSSEDAESYLIGISPWAQGDTPRPRSKHVNATLWAFRERVRELIRVHATSIAELATSLTDVYRTHLGAAISLARGASAAGRSLRDSYKTLEPRDGLSRVPTKLLVLEAGKLSVATEKGDVVVTFRTAEEAARAAVTIWTCMPLELPLGEALNLKFTDEDLPSAPAVQRALFDLSWGSRIGRPRAAESPTEEGSD